MGVRVHEMTSRGCRTYIKKERRMSVVKSQDLVEMEILNNIANKIKQKHKGFFKNFWRWVKFTKDTNAKGYTLEVKTWADTAVATIELQGKNLITQIHKPNEWDCKAYEQYDYDLADPDYEERIVEHVEDWFRRRGR